MRYFILLSIITHGLLLALWDSVQIDALYKPSTTHNGNTLSVTLQPSPQTPQDSQRQANPTKSTPPLPTIATTHHIETAPSATALPSPTPPRRLVAATPPAPPPAPPQITATPAALTVMALPPSVPQSQPATSFSPQTSIATNTKVIAPIDDNPTGARLQQKLNQAFEPHFHYPRLARKRGWQGTVELGLHISASGTLSNIRVMQSSGYRVLDRAAIRSLQQLGTLPEAKGWLTQGYDGIFPIHYELIDG